MFGSIIGTAGTFDFPTMMICVGVSLILGLVIALVYMKIEGTYSANFVTSLVLLPALVCVVISMVNGNLGTGVAVMGAFSLIRFRSLPGNAKEIATVFFTMAIGLATATGYIAFAVVITILICLVLIALSLIKFGQKRGDVKELKISIPENLDYTDVFDDIFAKYTKNVQMESVKTTNLGSMYELRYQVSFADSTKEKEMIDELRCRNGNLPIVCARKQTNMGEL